MSIPYHITVHCTYLRCGHKISVASVIRWRTVVDFELKRDEFCPSCELSAADAERRLARNPRREGEYLYYDDSPFEYLVPEYGERPEVSEWLDNESFGRPK